MGLPFRRKDAIASVSANPYDTPELAAVAQGETLYALIRNLLDKGSFLGSLDQDPDYSIEPGPDGLQIAQNDRDLALCILADRVAGFSIIGVDPGRMVFLIVDPVVHHIFERQADWHTKEDQPDLWIARLSLGAGLSLLLDCKAGPAELATEAGTRRGATLTLQVLMEH